jgi:hypothetical protein
MKYILCVTALLAGLLLTGCGGGGGSSNPVAPAPSNPVDTTLQTNYPTLYNANVIMEEVLQDNTKSSDDRIASFGVFIADDFKDIEGNANKKSELLTTTKSRLERYIINSYEFKPVDYEVIASDTIEVTTDMLIDVTRKEGAAGAVSKASIPLTNKIVTWKKYGSEWKLYQGLPYKSSEISI